MTFRDIVKQSTDLFQILEITCKSLYTFENWHGYTLRSIEQIQPRRQSRPGGNHAQMTTPFRVQLENHNFGPEGRRDFRIGAKCLQWAHLYMTYEAIQAVKRLLFELLRKNDFQGRTAPIFQLTLWLFFSIFVYSSERLPTFR